MSQKPHPTGDRKSAVGKDKKHQHITKITAKSSSDATAEATQTSSTKQPDAVKSQPAAQPEPTQNPKTATNKKSKKSQDKAEKPLKQVFILFRPFVALGRYIRDSWREIRQVRWPNRKATWKMTLAVLVYCAIFMVFILLLDTLFTFLFNLIVQK